MADPDDGPVRCTHCRWTGRERDLLALLMPYGYLVVCPRCGCETVEWPT